MNEQLPNIALVGSPYLFTLAYGTYGSSTGAGVNYTATGLPSWLLFDEASRTFTGMPQLKDVGSFQITLNGLDLRDQSTLSNAYLMLVADTTQINLSSPDVMFTTIAKYGQTNGQDGLVVRPGEQFSIQFSKDVFNPNGNIKAYYGRSQDRTPLPNWINFDSGSLTFSGTVPQVVSSIAPSFSYNFCFISADYPGYASAVGTFNLVVGAHLLSTSFIESFKINGTYGSKLNQTVPVLTSVFLDQKAVTPQNLSSVSLKDAPSFVTLGANYTLQGTFPNSTSTANFSVLVKDVFGNSVDLPYQISSLGSLFTVSSLPDVNATRGQYFELQLMKSYFTDVNSSSIDVSTNSTWLKYESSNMTLLGMVPSDFQQASVQVKATENNLNNELSFDIHGINREAMTSSSSLTSSGSTKSSPTATESSQTSDSTPTLDTSNPRNNGSNRRNLIIGLSAGIGGTALLACLAILLFCLCRRRKDDENDDEKHTVDPNEPELTGPGFGTTFDLDDHTEIARQLGTLNAMKLDEDNESDVLCDTHVDPEEENCEYLDDFGKPRKSWRAKDMSDSSAVKKMLQEQNRRSEMSLNTINTEQLFSVRVVDDSNSNRVSRQSDLAELARDTSSANVQRLDSDGNITEQLPAASRAFESRDNLNKVVEESPDTTDTSHNMTQVSSVYSLMAKLDQDVLQRDPSFGVTSDNSLNETFKPVKASNGEVHWKNQEYPDTSSTLTGPGSDLLLKQNIQTHFGSKSPINSHVFEEDRKAFKAKLVDFTRKASLKDSSYEQRYDHPAAEGQILDDDSLN